MRRAFGLAFVTVVATTSVAIAGTVAIGPSQTDSTSCTCSTVDLASGSVTLVVLANGTDAGSLSVSQQVSQTNDHARVRIDIEHGETSVEIAGETVENGSLVLNVTRNGEVVNDSVVADGNETRTVTFLLSSDGVRVRTDEEAPSDCCKDAGTDVLSDTDVVAGDGADIETSATCGANSDVDVNVGNVAEDINVKTGNVSVNIPILGSGDSSTNAEQVIDDSNDSFRSGANANGSDADSARRTECGASSDDENSSTDISAPGQSGDLAGLAVERSDRRTSIGSIVSTLRQELGLEEE